MKTMRTEIRPEGARRFGMRLGIRIPQVTDFETRFRNRSSGSMRSLPDLSKGISQCLVTAISMFSGTTVSSMQAEPPLDSPPSIEFVGRVLDDRTGLPAAARVYLRDGDDQWHFVETADDRGSAWPYAEQWVPMPESVERHTTVSAHPFRVRLQPGEYEIEIERGKEYPPLREKISIPPIGEKCQSPHVRWNGHFGSNASSTWHRAAGIPAKRTCMAESSSCRTSCWRKISTSLSR